MVPTGPRDAVDRLVLGTAQFGDAYGATNTDGRLPDDMVASTLERAWTLGVRTLDTAAGYGDAESRIGRLSGREFEVVTKVFLDEGFLADPVGSARTASRRLGLPVLDTVLIHNAAALGNFDPERVREALRNILESQVAGRVGVSVYDEIELEEWVTSIPEIAVVQIPGSVVDRRILDSPVLDQARAASVEVHVRSAFLQGVLLAEPGSLPARVAGLNTLVAEVRRTAEEAQCELVGALLAFVRDHKSVDKVVIGALGPDQLESSVRAWSAPGCDWSGLDSTGWAGLVDPRRWPPA